MLPGVADTSIVVEEFWKWKKLRRNEKYKKLNVSPNQP